MNGENDDNQEMGDSFSDHFIYLDHRNNWTLWLVANPQNQNSKGNRIRQGLTFKVLPLGFSICEPWIN